ncbi:MAG: methyltransferase domain-containing protein [Myxococcota bacterium]
MATTLLETGYRAHKTGIAVVTGVFMRLFHQLLRPNPMSLESPPAGSLDALRRRFEALLDQDLRNARAGDYPQALLFRTGLRDALRALPRGVWEIPRVLARARRKKFDDLPAMPHAERFPNYYKRTFHWQSDGWFSSHSAAMYDPGVDLLFGGMADVMRRMVVPDLRAHLARAVPAGETPRVLDVACGTGRFLGQLHAALPDARLYGLDLSAPYLKHAQAHLAHVPELSLVAENAEAMPFADQTFDAVTSIFLFHELPSDARRAVMREALRVVKPGGLFAIVDSAQADDAAEIRWYLEQFPVLYHEPYFKGYLIDPLPDALREVGFEVLDSRPAFVSRVVIARRPLEAAPASSPVPTP